jgi:Putative Ig domain
VLTGSVRAVLTTGLAGLALLASTAAASAGPSATAPLPHVTVLGDSVLTAVEWNDAPLATLQHGFDMYMDIAVCRTVSGVSCPFQGGRVPTLMDVIGALGIRLGPTVLVETGYNDLPQELEDEVETAVRAMLDLGVQRILWANFPDYSEHWATMNDALAHVAARHPQMTVIDWDTYSHDHWSWFQGDGIHLVYDGAMAMATLFNQALLAATAPPPPPPPPLRAVPTTLPRALVGRAYATHLVAEAGTAPYRWRSIGGRLPRGLHLLANGTIEGVPRRAGAAVLTLKVVDARGSAATVRERLVIGTSSRSAAGARP